MAEGDEAYRKYLDYDWEADQQWSIHRLNVYIPPGGDEAKLLEKIRRKYYQRHVDSSIVFPDETPQPAPTYTPSYTPPPSPSYSTSSSSSSSSSSSYTPPPSSSSSYTSTNTGRQAGFSFSSTVGIMSAIWLAANLYLLVHAVLFVLSGSPEYYSSVLLAAVVTYVLNIFATFGFPQFNMAYFQRLAQHESFHYFALCLVFLNYPPVLVFIPIITLYAFFNSCNFLNSVLASLGPFAAGTVLPLVQKALTYQTRALGAAANLEVMLMPFLIWKLFFGGGGILMVLMYWQFLNYRYLTNANVRVLLSEVGRKMDELSLRYLPDGVRGYYQKVRKFFAQFVDPAFMQQTYQAYAGQQRT